MSTRLTDLPLDAIETASRAELQALQLERLRWSLNHAYANSPVYRRKFDEAGIHPDQLHSLADLARFPFTSKQDLRDNYPFGMFAVPQDRVARIHASSGTTGKPTVVGYTLQDIDNWATVMARSIRASARGARQGAHQLRLRPLHRRPGRALRRGEGGLTAIPFGGGQTERQVQLIQDFKPEVIMVTPSYMLAIATSSSARASTRPAARCALASSARSRGRRKCGWRSRSAWASRPSISMACQR